MKNRELLTLNFLSIRFCSRYILLNVFASTTTQIIEFFSTATNVEIELPVPADATNPNVRTSMGSASYAPEKDALIWKIRSFPGGKV